MALTGIDFPRFKVPSFVNDSAVFSVATVDEPVGFTGSFVVDYTITDAAFAAGGGATKTVIRDVITPTFSGKSLTFVTQRYTFPGNAPDTVAGGLIPALDEATLQAGDIQTPIDFDAFYLAAGAVAPE